LGTPRSNPSETSARTIEQIVRAGLLLGVLALSGICGLLVERGWLGLVSVVAATGALVAIGHLLVRAPLRKLATLVSRVALGLTLVFFVLVGLVPKLGWYRPLTVLSGSMRPTFSPGDLIIVTPEPLSHVRVGQVISYYVPVDGHPLDTHRIIRVLRGGPHPIVQTQGDANNWRDPWTAHLHGSPAWKLSLVVPYAGYLINVLRGHTLHVAAIVFAPALFALLTLAEIWGLGGAAARLRRRLPPRHDHAHS
jgi:signal peptidase I